MDDTDRGLQVGPYNSGRQPTVQASMARVCFSSVITRTNSAPLADLWPALSRPVLKNLGFLVFFKKPKKFEKLGFQIFQVFRFSSQKFYFFMSNSVKFYEFIRFITFSIAMHELIFVYSFLIYYMRKCFWNGRRPYVSLLYNVRVGDIQSENIS